MHFKYTGMFLLALASFASASPILKDIHETTLDLLESDSATTADGLHYGRFAVKVERIDEVVDVKEGGQMDVEAVRVSDVMVSFDVSPAGDVSVNGQSIPLGMSNIQVEGDIIYGLGADSVSSLDQASKVGKAFDVGIIGMAVQVTGETVKEDDLEFSRIIIAEVITEINGVEVVQSESMQQVLEILPSGEIRKNAPEPASASALDALADKDSAPHRRPCNRVLFAKMVQWFNRLPLVGRLVLSTALGGLFGYILANVVRLVAVVVRACFSKSSTEENERLTSDNSIYPGTAEKLPAYDPNGYARLASTEKLEEKQ